MDPAGVHGAGTGAPSEAADRVPSPPTGASAELAASVEREQHTNPAPRTAWAKQAPRWGFAFVLLCYLAIAASYLLPLPTASSSAAFLTLAWLAFLLRTFLVYAGLSAALVSVIFLIRRRWRVALLLAPLMLVALVPEAGSYFRHRPAASGPAVRVMTLNLFRGNQDAPAVLAEIHRIAPDVICFEEYTERWHTALSGALAAGYPFAEHACTNASRGTAIYSSRPFAVTPEVLSLGAECGPQLRAGVAIGDRAVSLYCVHLLPPSSGRRFSGQVQQFAHLREILGRETLPVVLCGDFNLTNRTAQAAALAQDGLCDVNLIAGAGPAHTWPVRGLFRCVPGVRIDHIYLAPELTCSRADVGGDVGSDHRAVVAEIAFSDSDHARP